MRHDLRAATVYFFMAAVAIAASLPCYGQDAAIDHPVHAFLERCEARGAFDHLLPSTYPYSRARILHLLKQAAEQREQLSPTERRRLDWYLAEFARDDAGTRPYGIPLYRNRRDLYSLSQPDWGVYFNPVFLAESNRSNSDLDSLRGTTYMWGSGAALHGYVQTFSFFAAATDRHVRGDTRLADPADYPYRYGWQTEGFDFDEAVAGIGWDSRHIELYFGKSRNRWGPALNEALTLSDHPTSYTNFRSRFRLGPLELSSVQARLQQYPPLVSVSDTTVDGIPRPHYADKYFAAHRLEWNVNSRLRVGLNESIIYGERGFDLEYLHPLLFLRSAEHYTGDRDNALIGGDFKWQIVEGTTVYGEVLVDDVTTTRLGTGWFGNKFAWQAGLRVFDPWSGTLRMICEYARVEPYVYSHKFPINNYQHYGTLLGASIGPNSDAINASLAWAVSRPLELEGWGRVLRHGDNPASGRNVGGDYTRTWVSGDSKYAPFLDGDRSTLLSIGIRGRYELFYNLFIRGALQTDRSILRAEATNETRSSGSRYFIGLDWNRM